MINSDNTDIDGIVVFNIKETCTDLEQIKNLFIRLSGTPDEKTIILTVPAKKKPKKTVKDINVKVSSTIDADTNKFFLSFECTITEDGQAFGNQPVILKRNLIDVANDTTDVHGQTTLHADADLGKTERVATYRVCLVNFPGVEKEVNVSIPAEVLKKKEDNDPEHLVLMSHSDGKGNFRVKARITKFKGDALAGIPFSIWCKGKNRVYKTNDQGEKAFDVPGTFKKGQKEELVATVSGIQKKCKITLKRNETFRKTRFEKLIKLGWFVALGLWFLAVLIGPGKPLINPDIFNGKDGLSISERLYNESATAPNDYRIEPSGGNWFQKTVDHCRKSIWLIASVITLVVLIITIRYIFRAIIFRSEEALESVLHKSYDNVGDPLFEELSKYVGSYNAVSRKPAVAHVDQVASEEPASGVISDNQPAEHKAEHKKGVERSSLFTFIGVDLLIEMALAILKKTFSK
ncbi:MAG: hypothetical protein Q8N57_03100 [bacterium]|nr:hypothetical protein [bacterium]